MGLLYGRAGRLTAQNGGFRRGQGAGQTYEREAIATWLRTKQTDPLTGARLPSKKLIENVVARQAIARWRGEHPGYTE